MGSAAGKMAPVQKSTEKPTTTLEHLLGGVNVSDDGAACDKARDVISSFFASKFNGRAPTKPIDLLNLIDSHSEITIKMAADASGSGSVLSDAYNSLFHEHLRGMKSRVGSKPVHNYPYAHMYNELSFALLEKRKENAAF